MSARKGAMIGAAVAFLFYVALSMMTPLEGKSVFPTANAIANSGAMAEYVKDLPASIIVFISLEVVGLILGAIGYKIIAESTPREKSVKK